MNGTVATPRRRLERKLTKLHTYILCMVEKSLGGLSHNSTSKGIKSSADDSTRYRDNFRKVDDSFLSSFSKKTKANSFVYFD